MSFLSHINRLPPALFVGTPCLCPRWQTPFGLTRRVPPWRKHGCTTWWAGPVRSGHFFRSPSAEGERIRATPPHTAPRPPPLPESRLTHHGGRTKKNNPHDTESSEWENVCVFKNKGNIIKEDLLFCVEKYKGKVVVSWQSYSLPYGQRRSWHGSEFC